MPTTRSRTIGGNPLRNLAIRQGKVAEPPPVHSRRPYTDADRARLLAPIAIRSFGGKSWGGAVPNSLGIPTRNHRYTGEAASDRYVHSSDWSDVDHL